VPTRREAPCSQAGARDLAGNPLDQNPNKAGNQQMVWRFKVQ
jgi:hypothetical protein